jgi:hypothetical protein
MWKRTEGDTKTNDAPKCSKQEEKPLFLAYNYDSDDEGTDMHINMGKGGTKPPVKK